MLTQSSASLPPPPLNASLKLYMGSFMLQTSFLLPPPCHSSTHLLFESVIMRNVSEWARLLQAICHATNKSTSSMVIEWRGPRPTPHPPLPTKDGI